MRPVNIIANKQLGPYEEVKKQLKASADKLQALHPEWVLNNDARISWFQGTYKGLIIVQIECLLIEKYLSRKDWWKDNQQISGNLETVPIFLKEYDIYIRFYTTFLPVFIQLEESLRQIIKHLDPKAYNERQGSFARLYSFLLEKTGLSIKFDQLFKLIAYTRNTIHNNGVFSPSKGGDKDIEWKGKKFEFRVGKGIQWLTHDILRQFILWLNEAMLAIMVSEPVGQMSIVKRLEGE